MRKYLIILLLSISYSLTATNYYVKNGGNDGLSGTSDANAWATINKVNTSSFLAGDTIFFRKGDVWRETLTIPSSGNSTSKIVFTSYGIGEKPIITGADIFSSWTQEVDNYYTAFSVSPKFVFDDGTPLTAVTLKASLVTGTFWRDVPNSRIYIVGNPSGSIIEMVVRDDAINTNNADYIVIDGLKLTSTNFHGINAQLSIYSEFKNNNIDYITSRGIYVNNWSAPGNYVTIDGNYFNHIQGYSCYIYGGGDTIRNNIIKNTGDYYSTATPYAAYPAGIDIIENGVTGVVNTQIYNNIIDSLNAGVLTQYCHGMYIQYNTSGLNIYGNTVSNIRAGEGIKFAGLGNVHSNIFYNNYHAAIGVHENRTGIVNIYNNLMYNNGYGIQQYDFVGDLILNIYDNTFYKNGIDSPASDNAEIKIRDYITVNLKNNIFYASDAHSCLHFSYMPKSLSSDYNIFYREDAGDFITYAVNPAKTWVEWQGLGFDAHSYNTNPLMISATNYHLQKGSPAINTGTYMGMSTDIEGLPIYGEPDIGAYDSAFRYIIVKDGIIQTHLNKILRITK